MQTRAGAMQSDDPFDAVLRPPPDESPEQAALREAREAEARRVSAAIDADIRAERQARRKKRIVRLLLLGQSESGKSTTLRQFQRLYTPTAFREERILWRAVIQLNLVRSIRTILEALDAPAPSSPSSLSSPRARVPSASMLALAGPSGSNSHSPPMGVGLPLPSTTADITDPTLAYPSPSHGYQYPYDGGVDSDPESDPENRSTYHYGSPGRSSRFAVNMNGNGNGSVWDGGGASHASGAGYASAGGGGGGGGGGGNGGGGGGANATWDALRLRLLPLRHVEALLIARLVPPNEDEPTRFAPPSSESDSAGGGGGGDRDRGGGGREIFVRPGNRWKGPRHASPSGSSHRPEKDEPQEALTACAPVMRALWADPGVREVLRRRKIRLEEGPGFFLNDLDRVTGPNYLPTDDDVLRARLKTVGVSEYTFEMEVPTGRETGTEWRIVDVGGSRTTWVPFFDDVDAIIFLAPIAGFDQVLAEDRTVNRLEDSVLLWKAVCSNKLLASVDLVLFLNKCDILERKLKAGVKLVRYVRSYADRENSFEAVSQYLRSKFSAIHREYSPNPRKFYAFCTSVTDTATTGGIIASVRDMVVRQHLKQSKLL
ncbi:guanine nucleotide binding protein, alpha subunit [Mycena polygramma]|nr:guanine nucleotide binding protein, alpha subunit [Mycena polygramma]